MDIKSELEKVEKQINKKCIDYVNTRGKAQIANILDKIENRKKMPDFKSVVIFEDKPCEVTFTQFLKGINTDVDEKDRPELIKLEKRHMALSLLLETEEKV